MAKPRGEMRNYSNCLVVRPAPGQKSRALLQYGALTFPAAIGRNGRTVLKKEGDGKTPIASMRILDGFMRGDRLKNIRSPLNLKRVRSTMLWCDAPNHASYNRPVSEPFKASHEELMRQDGLYDICIVLDWNISTRSRNRGSAIFFHLIRPGYQPTAGCVGLSLRDMQRLLPHLRKGMTLKVI